MKITETELLEQLEDIFEKDLEEMKINDSFKDYDEWDSLTQLSLLAFLNDDYDIILNNNDLDNLNTISDIFNLINNS